MANTLDTPKVIWSTLYEQWVCIYKSTKNGNWTTERFDSQEEAEDFKKREEEKRLAKIWYFN